MTILEVLMNYMMLISVFFQPPLVSFSFSDEAKLTRSCCVLSCRYFLSACGCVAPQNRFAVRLGSIVCVVGSIAILFISHSPLFCLILPQISADIFCI